MPARGYSHTPKAKARVKPKPPPDVTTLPNEPNAIRRYQQFHRLPPTGKVDPRTGRHMQDNHTRLGDSPYETTWRRGRKFKA